MVGPKIEVRAYVALINELDKEISVMTARDNVQSSIILAAFNSVGKAKSVEILDGLLSGSASEEFKNGILSYRNSIINDGVLG